MSFHCRFNIFFWPSFSIELFIWFWFNRNCFTALSKKSKLFGSAACVWGCLSSTCSFVLNVFSICFCHCLFISSLLPRLLFCLYSIKVSVHTSSIKTQKNSYGLMFEIFKYLRVFLLAHSPVSRSVSIVRGQYRNQNNNAKKLFIFMANHVLLLHKCSYSNRNKVIPLYGLVC